MSFEINGRLYLSTPIGRERVCFNAHRVFEPATIVAWFDQLHLTQFSFVSDDGQFHRDVSISHIPDLEYGCGFFEFQRIIRLGSLYLRAHLREMSWVVVAQSAGVIGALASVKAATTARLAPVTMVVLPPLWRSPAWCRFACTAPLRRARRRFCSFRPRRDRLRTIYARWSCCFALAVGAVISIWTVAYLAGIDASFSAPTGFLPFLSSRMDRKWSCSGS